MNYQHDVFISHSKKDEALAKHIHDHLRTAKLNVFLAPWSIRYGTDWRSEYIRAVETSKAVVVLVSKASMASPNVQQEIACAMAHNRLVVPVALDMPLADLTRYGLGHLQAVGFYGRSAIERYLEVQRLIAQLRQTAPTAGEVILWGLITVGLIAALSNE